MTSRFVFDVPATLCDCGWRPPHGLEYMSQRDVSLFGRQHARSHEPFEHGVHSDVAAGIVMVKGSETGALSRVTHVLARAFREQGHYDFTIWQKTPTLVRRRLTGFLFCERGRAIGLAVTEPTEHRLWYDYTPRSMDDEHLIDGGPGHQVCLIFVASAFRRRGIALALLNEVANRLGENIRDLAASTPLTEAGLSVFRTVNGDDGFWVA